VGWAQDSHGWRPSACGSTMRNVSKSLLVVTALAVAVGAAASFGYVWREVPREAPRLADTTVDLPPAHETVGLAELRGLDRSSKADISPVFDIVRIEPGGDAVIAGRSVPGATVALLRDGVIQDKATANGSGQFVMTPPRLPPGRHELTLVAMQPDGTQATSKRSVSVAVAPNETR
jgi:hypothetical protein